MSVLTPCLPKKSCVICESRMFPKSAPPEKKAASYRHRAGHYGNAAVECVDNGHADDAYACARVAAGFARLALDTHHVAALSGVA